MERISFFQRLGITLLTLLLAPLAIFAQAGRPAPGRVIIREAAPPGQEVPAGDHAVYCAGFIEAQRVGGTLYVFGGEDNTQFNPQRQYVQGDQVFLRGRLGESFSEGTEYQVVRREGNPWWNSWYHNQPWKTKKMGYIYADVARLKVDLIRPEGAIARVTYSCDPIKRGDLITALRTRPQPMVRQPKEYNAYALPTGKTKAIIAYTQDRRGVVAAGSIVYLNLGQTEGIQPGNYFRIYRIDHRNYLYEVFPPLMPREIVGELVVLDVREKSATALVTHSRREIFPGDGVELE